LTTCIAERIASGRFVRQRNYRLYTLRASTRAPPPARAAAARTRDDDRSTFAFASDRVVVLVWGEVAALFHSTCPCGLGAVGPATPGAQAPVEAVVSTPSPPVLLSREVEPPVVPVRARDADVAAAHLGLHRFRLVMTITGRRNLRAVKLSARGRVSSANRRDLLRAARTLRCGDVRRLSRGSPVVRRQERVWGSAIRHRRA